MLNMLFFLLSLPLALIGIIVLPVCLILLIPLKLLTAILESLYHISKSMVMIPARAFDAPNKPKKGTRKQP
jgi:hypothetical protein